MKLSKKMCPTTIEEKTSMVKVKVSYSSVFESLMYAMVYTTPGIAHAVDVVCRFLNNLGKNLGKL